MTQAPIGSTQRELVALEAAADELARLDLLLLRLPPAAALASWLATVAAASNDTASFRPLVAAAADPIHDALLPRAVFELRGFASAEERRVRGGALLSLSRWTALAPGIATYPERPRLEALWQEAPADRPALLRAIGSAACLDSDDPAAARIADLSAALLLCAAGRTAHLRFLPFTRIDAALRSAATRAWREGAEEEWTRIALAEVARSARRARELVQGLEGEGDATALASMGRAAISARRAMNQVRATLATTMPVLAEQLELSRPAASDALERLTSAGLLVEVTGRARDRVYAWAAAIAIAEGTLEA